MKKDLLLLGAILLVGAILIGVAALRNANQAAPEERGPAAVPEAPSSVTGLSWDLYVTEAAEWPETSVTLVALHEDGSSTRIPADSVEGECNAEDTETDLALDSTQLTCYYAGLGHKFRVIETNDEYLLQMQVFEEASPEYDPPVQEFVTLRAIAK
jgi:hypothetical protein